MSGNQENGVRPSIWMLTALVAALTVAALYFVWPFAPNTAIGRDPNPGRMPTYGPTHRYEEYSVNHPGYPPDDFDHDQLHGGHYVGGADDPQIRASRASFDLSGDAGVPWTFSAHYSSGEITEFEGDVEASIGDECEVRILPLGQHSTFNCLIRVRCGETILYPDSVQNAGYVWCESDGVTVSHAADMMPTPQDGDPTVTFDRETGEVRVSDSRPDGTHFSTVLNLRGHDPEA